MNKRLQASHRSNLTFGDLVIAVSSASRDSLEATLAITDLLRTGRVAIGRRRVSRRQPADL